MDKINEAPALPPLPQASSSRRSPAQRANDANPEKDGPHRKVKKEVSEKDAAQPPCVIAVVKKDKPDLSAEPVAELAKARPVYDPKELRAKARALLSNDHISLEQRRVLKDILGPEEKD